MALAFFIIGAINIIFILYDVPVQQYFVFNAQWFFYFIEVLTYAYYYDTI